MAILHLAANQAVTSTCLMTIVCLGLIHPFAQSMSIPQPDTLSAEATKFFVSPSGSDSANGDADHPFRTITRAQTAVQSLKQRNGGHVPSPGVVVNVASGSYDFSDSPFVLTKNDSGEADARVVYQGMSGAVLSGGRAIPTSSWEHYRVVSTEPNNVAGGYTEHGTFNIKDYHHHHNNEDDERSAMENELNPSSTAGGNNRDVPKTHHVVRRQVVAQEVNIMKIDLKKLNITNYGDLGNGQLGDCANNKLEAFYGGKPLVLARHPNIGSDGKPQFLNIVKVIKATSSFEFNDPVLSGLKDYGSLWLHGYWGQDWADNYVRVQGINGSTITTDTKTPPLYGYHNKARFYALNVLEFLDSPGEYYLDRDTGILYFALPADTPADDMITVSMSPTILSLTNVSYLTLDGLDVMYSRETAVDSHTISFDACMEDHISTLPSKPRPGLGRAVHARNITFGIWDLWYAFTSADMVTIRSSHLALSRTSFGKLYKHCHPDGALNVTISNGEFTCHGGRAVHMSGATNTLVHNISVHGVGCGGIAVEGGDLNSLTRGESSTQHCTVFDFARWKRTYNPAISFSGVGNYYLHNTISGGPHSAMLGSCNDCLFAYNNISNMCFESTDTGAFYTGRSWIHRGNVMHNNIFSHIRTTEHTVLGSPSVQAIYLDDQMSGFEIYNNTFIDCQKGTFVGGGRRNHVYNNYYEDCDDAVHLDARGLNWQKAMCQKTGQFYQQMQQVHYDQPPWSTHYPDILTIFSDHPCYPTDTSYTDNTYCKCQHFADVSATQMKEWYASMADNVEKCH